MSLVSLKKLPSYDDEEAVFSAVCAHMEALEVGKDIHPDLKILLKPNLLSGRRPELAVTTHHSIVASVVRYLKECGAEKILIAESSGGLYTEDYMRQVYAASGLDRAELAPYLNHDFTWKTVPVRKGFSVRSFNLITPVTEADYIINLGKLKTHSMTTMTAAVKNLFGTIPGLQKPDMHCRYPELEDFVRMLCELAVTVDPDVSLLDAVLSMEGNGPGGGTPKHTGLTMASRNPFALDTAAARFMGLGEDRVPHLIMARSMGLLPEEPEFIGDPFVPAEVPFVLPDTIQRPSFADSVPKPFRKGAEQVLNWLLRSYPHVDRSKCIGCGKCAESCPQKIIQVKDGKAGMPRRGCISCFCCQEMCPARAIEAKRRVKW